jgi:hypothetical protein
VQTSNASGAAATAGHACRACGADSEYGLAAISALVDAGIELPSACTPLGGGALAGIILGSLVGIGTLVAARNAVARRALRQAPLKAASPPGKKMGTSATQPVGDDVVGPTPATQTA